MKSRIIREQFFNWTIHETIEHTQENFENLKNFQGFFKKIVKFQEKKSEKNLD